ncbi:Down syndrome critical region protein 3 homolog isoform X2 [Cynara cardunculus var. scolymus]|uniref:Down syndrome critical region protein 3 homolog isoform X2 n=1 Tax=Cynara cardunculus var. scolymus TaxID=59895 RepID=UPI000D6304C3|nr:Down syndrome critical region protein 3 homolog isoform X2 [Cynara cardunculus var. scolymus]
MVLSICRKKSIEVQPSGKISAGTTQIPFSMILKNQGEEHKFYETFHGANISIQYLLNVDVVRGYLHKSLSATVEFIIESDLASLPEKPVSPEMVFFYITQDTQRHSLLTELKSGGFKISGRICTQCLLSDPLVGELTVEASAVPIYSIDIHLLRIESIMVGEKIATETSIIQTTQIADGDVCRTMSLPIYVVLPRLLTCPTVFAGPFSIEFKVTILVTFQTELYNVQPKSDPRAFRKWVAMESLPLELVQSN